MKWGEKNQKKQTMPSVPETQARTKCGKGNRPTKYQNTPIDWTDSGS